MNSTAPIRTDATPLDEVMLAMDIVDTLRHERSTIERELDADARDAALVERIKGIYAGQGIEVTDDLVRKGVEALKQDRFVYVPPKPSLSLRLAHMYIERWKWIGGISVATVLLSGGWLASRLPQQWADGRAYSAYSAEFDALAPRNDRVDAELQRLTRWQQARVEGEPIVRTATGRLIDEIELAMQRARALAADRSTTPKLDDDAIAAMSTAGTRAVASRNAVLVDAENALAQVDAKMRQIDTLDSLARKFIAAMTILDGSVLGSEDRVLTEALRAQAEASLRAGNVPIAESAVNQLEQTATQLSLAYELRIVSGEGVRSGIWRYPVDNPSGKNFYLVVEAIGESGAPLLLPITNEETQKIEQVVRFAVRVPEAVYESVKADKLDNGLIDNALVGNKRRGTLQPQFAVPVAGGYITRWED